MGGVVSRCGGGCSFWRCGRSAGHSGPCQPRSLELALRWIEFSLMGAVGGGAVFIAWTHLTPAAGVLAGAGVLVALESIAFSLFAEAD